MREYVQLVQQKFIRILVKDPIFYLNNVSSYKDGIISNYTKYFQDCSNDKISVKNLEVVKVITEKLDLDTKQVKYFTLILILIMQ